MRHLELHILQSFPVACLNRDDLGSPKTAVFGGVQRARVSSQCWKRAIRLSAREELPSYFAGVRTKLVAQMFKDEFVKQGEESKRAEELATDLADAIANLDGGANDDGGNESKAKKSKGKKREQKTGEGAGTDGALPRVKTLTYLAPGEVKRLCQIVREKHDSQRALKVLAKGSASLVDAADIALFGRMVANESSLTLEGAAVFSHALSTHKVDNELDFFSAVDDLQPKEESGAGMMGSLEFNSATYYRFVGVNLDLLKQESHLGALDQDKRREVIKAFLKATLLAVPSARTNSMNANTLPICVLGVVREKGHPIQLINAFEKAVRLEVGNSLAEVSCARMKEEYGRLKNTWGLDGYEAWMPEIKCEDFIERMVSHA